MQQAINSLALADCIKAFKNKLHAETVKFECKKHGIRSVKKMTYGDKVAQVPECDLCKKEQQSAEQRQQKVIQKQQRQAYYMKQLDAFSRFSDYSFEKHDPQRFPETKSVANLAKKYCQNLCACFEDGVSIMMHGNVGTGKTFFAVSILKKAIMQGYSAKYIELPTLLREVKNSFKYPDFNEQAKINELARYDFLVLDEMGIGSGSEFDKTFIFSLVNQRYNMKKPTIGISNLSIDALKPVVGARVIDRLLDKSLELKFTWESLRNKFH